MEDWAEVHRLFHREGRPKAAIARQLGMSRNTVERLLGLTKPPRYVRRPVGSQLDPFVERIAAMLAVEPTVRATVIRERLRPLGYQGGITILKDHLARPRLTRGLSGRSHLTTMATSCQQLPARGRKTPATDPAEGRRFEPVLADLLLCLGWLAWRTLRSRSRRRLRRARGHHRGLAGRALVSPAGAGCAIGAVIRERLAMLPIAVAAASSAAPAAADRTAAAAISALAAPSASDVAYSSRPSPITVSPRAAS